MEPLDSRSDSRFTVLSASPSEVFAALADPARVARWWGPAGFSSTIERFEFEPGGRWSLTMHGPDGQDHPNESRFTRIVPHRLVEIEHVSGHHFLLTIELTAVPGGTRVGWRQTFDSAAHYEPLAGFLATANEQNLDRLAAEVGRAHPSRVEQGPR